MGENIVKIIGIKETESKKSPGTKYFNYYYTTSFSAYDKDHSICSGISCGVEFSNRKLDCQVGDEVELKYVPGYQGKASLVGCTVIKSASAK